MVACSAHPVGKSLGCMCMRKCLSAVSSKTRRDEDQYYIDSTRLDCKLHAEKLERYSRGVRIPEYSKFNTVLVLPVVRVS